MLEKTKGIVFHTTNFSETSVVVKIYTRQFGIQSYLVNGVRKNKSKTSKNLFQPLTQVELITYQKKIPGLKRIKEIQCALQYKSIPFDTTKSATAIFLAEVLHRSIKEEECNTGLFDYISHALHIFDIGKENFADFHIFFMTGLTKYLGFYPDTRRFSRGNVFDLSEGVFTDSANLQNDFMDSNLTSKFAELLNCNFENYFLVDVNSFERKSLLQSLIKYYELHLTHQTKIKSQEVFQEIFQ